MTAIRSRTPYSDAELARILTRPPTRASIRELAIELKRSTNAIQLIYEIACTRRKHLNPRMLRGAFWKQVRRVASELGWLAVGVREGRRERPRCPKCGREDRVIPILYGFPSREAQKLADRGEVHLGGCVIEGGEPPWHCARCGFDFPPREESRAEPRARRLPTRRRSG